MAGVLSHMMDGGTSMEAFIKAWGGMPNASKTILFRDPRVASIQHELNRLYRVAKRLEPFVKISKTPGGVDFAKVGHLGTAAAMWWHFWPALTMLAGAGGASRVISSPRYLRWITAVPQAVGKGPGSPEAQRHLARLAAIAAADQQYGPQIMEAAKQMLMPPERNVQN